MRTFNAVLIFSLLVASVGNARTNEPQTSRLAGQKEHLSACTTEAKNKKLSRAAEKKFIDACLIEKEKEAAVSAPRPTPQQLYRTCRIKAEAQKLSSDAREQFLTNCLKQGNVSPSPK